MKYLRICILFLYLGCGASALAEVTIHNYVPAFVKYYDDAKNDSMEQRIAKWNRDYESLEPKLFAASMYHRDSKEQGLTKGWKYYDQLIDDWRETAISIEGTLKNKIQQIQKLFPNVELDLPIYIAVCPLSVGGFVDEFEGHPIMFMCVMGDKKITEFLITHEVFHAFHAKNNPAALGTSVADQLLAEGLAVLFTRQEFPDQTLAQLIGYAKFNPVIIDSIIPGFSGMGEKAMSYYVENRRELLDQLSVDLEKNKTVAENDGVRPETKWFGNGDKKLVKFFFTGYIAGFEICKELRKTMSLSEITSIPVADLPRVIREVLNKI